MNAIDIAYIFWPTTRGKCSVPCQVRFDVKCRGIHLRAFFPPFFRRGAYLIAMFRTLQLFVAVGVLEWYFSAFPD